MGDDALREAAATADVLLLAVKPAQLAAVGHALRDTPLRSTAVVLSVLAGVRCAAIASALRCDATRVVRAMPNVAAALQASASAWFGAPTLDAAAAARVDTLLGAVGCALRVGSEALVDAATAVAGSGTAFHLLWAEAHVDAAVRLGFTRTQARQLVVQTLAGAAALARDEPDVHLAALRARVVSPGGTTAAGLAAAEGAGLRAAADRTLDATLARAAAIAAEHD